MEDLLSVLFFLCANQRLTLIGSVRSCWHLFIFFLNWGCVLTGREITTGDGDEKGLLDDSELNTRYKDTGSDKKQGVPEGITHQ